MTRQERESKLAMVQFLEITRDTAVSRLIHDGAQRAIKAIKDELDADDRALLARDSYESETMDYAARNLRDQQARELDKRQCREAICEVKQPADPAGQAATI